MIIQELLNNYLGDTLQHYKPEKQMMLVNLKQYANSNKWININRSKKFLGWYNQHKVKVDEIYIPRISMQHQAIDELHKNLFYSNAIYKKFVMLFKIKLEAYFRSKESI